MLRQTPDIPGFRQADATGDEVPLAADPGVASAASGLTFGMEYGDAAGVVTRRIVRVLECGVVPNSPVIHFRAWCHLRGDMREFRSDRIRALFDWRTGEPIPDAGGLFARLASAAEDSDHVRAMERLGPRLAALLWVGRADGVLWDSEVAAMVVWAGAEAAPLALDEWACTAWLRWHRPDFDDFAASLPALGRDEEALSRFAEAMKSVIRADGVFHAAELRRMRRVMEEAVKGRAA